MDTLCQMIIPNDVIRTLKRRTITDKRTHLSEYILKLIDTVTSQYTYFPKQQKGNHYKNKQMKNYNTATPKNREHPYKQALNGWWRHHVSLCMIWYAPAKLKMLTKNKNNNKMLNKNNKILKNKLRNVEKISAAADVRMSMLKAMRQLAAETENAAARLLKNLMNCSVARFLRLHSYNSVAWIFFFWCILFLLFEFCVLLFCKSAFAQLECFMRARVCECVQIAIGADLQQTNWQLYWHIHKWHSNKDNQLCGSK